MNEFVEGSLVHVMRKSRQLDNIEFYATNANGSRKVGQAPFIYTQSSVFVVLEQRIRPKSAHYYDRILYLLSAEGRAGIVYVHYYDVVLLCDMHDVTLVEGT